MSTQRPPEVTKMTLSKLKYKNKAHMRWHWGQETQEEYKALSEQSATGLGKTKPIWTCIWQGIVRGSAGPWTCLPQPHGVTTERAGGKAGGKGTHCLFHLHLYWYHQTSELSGLREQQEHLEQRKLTLGGQEEEHLDDLDLLQSVKPDGFHLWVLRVSAIARPLSVIFEKS